MRAADRKMLLRLFGEACRIAETQVRNLGQPEVSRALEQDLLWALVTALAEGEERDGARGHGDGVQALIRFEEALETSSHASEGLTEICRSIGVSEAKLKVFSARILGMSPAHYLRARRLKPARPSVRGGMGIEPGGVGTR